MSEPHITVEAEAFEDHVLVEFGSASYRVSMDLAERICQMFNCSSFFSRRVLCKIGDGSATLGCILVTGCISALRGDIVTTRVDGPRGYVGNRFEFRKDTDNDHFES